jgi:hypothetical protein
VRPSEKRQASIYTGLDKPLRVTGPLKLKKPADHA